MKKRLPQILTVFLSLILGHGIAQSSYFVVEPGTTITEESGTTIFIDGDANSTLLLKDDYTYSPSFLQKGDIDFGSNVVDSVRVQQYLTKDEWHFVSSTVTHEVNEAFLWMYLYAYDEVSGGGNNGWDDQNLPLTITLPQGKGFLVWNHNDHNSIYPNNEDWPLPGDSVEYKGLTINNDINLALTYTSGIGDGWNLIGNPFACAVDWNNHTDWNLSNVTTTAYYYDGASGSYVEWNAGTNLGSKGDGYTTTSQGFFVKATATGSLTIPASQRSHQPSETMLKSDSYTYLKISVDSEFGHVENIIGFNENAPEGIDSFYDAYFLHGIGNTPQVYTVDDHEFLVHNFYPQIENNEVVPLNFETRKNGTYSMSFANLDSFDEDVPVWLEDKQTGEFIDIRKNNVYEFNGNVNDNYERFNVHFANPELPEEAFAAASIYSNKSTIYVIIPEDMEQLQVSVYNLVGELIIQYTPQVGMNTIPMTNNDQYYIVKLIGDTQSITEKVFIH